MELLQVEQVVAIIRKTSALDKDSTSPLFVYGEGDRPLFLILAITWFFVGRGAGKIIYQTTASISALLTARASDLLLIS